MKERYELYRIEHDYLTQQKVQAKSKKPKNPIPEGLKQRHEEMREAKRQAAKAKPEMKSDLAMKFEAEKEFCKKHYQPIMNIMHPDFGDSCMKCLREIFLKKSRGGVQAKEGG